MDGSQKHYTEPKKASYRIIPIVNLFIMKNTQCIVCRYMCI